ncbi:MAG: dTDP-glucose 4,6-dehydratase [Planctomycetota bacterium]
MIVTGGAGFIGGHYVEQCIKESNPTLVIDKLTYAADPVRLEKQCQKGEVESLQVDINDSSHVRDAFQTWKPNVVVHFAAESHVDRSIADATEFANTNFLGTLSMLRVSLEYFDSLSKHQQSDFRFVQISTDEVYGSAGEDVAFNEMDLLQPGNPYSASKAGADHLVQSFENTYGLPTLITRCCNNYGTHQHCEKLIPLMISAAVSNQPLPIYGEGQQVREWIHVKDHVSAINCIIEHSMSSGEAGQTFNIGTGQRPNNLEVVQRICSAVDRYCNRHDGTSAKNITFVEDRLGHDFRYALDSSSLASLGWKPEVALEDGIEKTVQWYCEQLLAET